MPITATLPAANTWQPWPFLKNSFEPLFRIYVYMVVLLPSGSVFGVNVKMICFALIFGPALLHLAQNRRMTLQHLGLLVLLPGIFSFWILLSQIYQLDLGLSFSEYRDIFITVVSCWLAAVYCGGSIPRRIRFLQMLLHAEVAACVLKILLLAYCFFRGVAVSTLVNLINHVTGVSLMGMDFESALGRIQFIADGLIPLCFYMLLRYRQRMGIATSTAVVMFGLLTISLVFTFSRYFWAFAVVAFLLGLLMGKWDRFHGILLVFLGAALVVSFPLLASVVQLRFSVDVAAGSDDVRHQQVPALERFFLEAPILGHGFGSHPSDVIRSDKLPYVYESQLLALAGQIGLVGMAFLALLTMYYFHALWPWDSSISLRHRASLTLLLVTWLVAGLLNPMLLNSAAAMSYAAIKAMAELGNGTERSSARALAA